MRITPYLNFNGNCADAIALYEKAFEVKAQIMRYKDAPASEEHQVTAENENYVMHASLQLSEAYSIFFSDLPPEMLTDLGSGMSIAIELDRVDQVNTAFNALKDGGEVFMELGQTFWSQYFGSLQDKFGLNWSVSVAENK